MLTTTLGANSEIIDKHYTHVGDEAQGKTMQAIYGNLGVTITNKDYINDALKYINSLPKKSKIIVNLERIIKQ